MIVSRPAFHLVTSSTQYLGETDGRELGDWVAVLLNNEFDTFVEDGSLEEVGNELVHYWNMYRKKELVELADRLDQLAAQPNTAESASTVSKTDSDDSSSEDLEEAEDEVIY